MTEQNPPPGIDDDTEGHRVVRKLEGDEVRDDDTTGHKVYMDTDAGTGDDDTTGHKVYMDTDAGTGDDTEGHLRKA